jgi:hypothetical protein
LNRLFARLLPQNEATYGQQCSTDYLKEPLLYHSLPSCTHTVSNRVDSLIFYYWRTELWHSSSECAYTIASAI